MKGLLRSIAISLFWLSTIAWGDEGATVQQVHTAYAQWTHAIEAAKGNPRPVVSLYAPKAILLATLAPAPITTHAEMDKYFAKLTSNKNMKVETQQIITQVFPHIAINS
jgi:hypothetical protein